MREHNTNAVKHTGWQTAPPAAVFNNLNIFILYNETTRCNFGSIVY